YRRNDGPLVRRRQSQRDVATAGVDRGRPCGEAGSIGPDLLTPAVEHPSHLRKNQATKLGFGTRRGGGVEAAVTEGEPAELERGARGRGVSGTARARGTDERCANVGEVRKGGPNGSRRTSGPKRDRVRHLQFDPTDLRLAHECRTSRVSP